MPNEPEKPPVVSIAPLTWKQDLFREARKQGPFTLILLIAIYIMASWIDSQMQWAKEQVPVHLQSIREGYKEVAQDYLAAKKESEVRQLETVKIITESSKDTMDRLESVLRSKTTEKRIIE